MTIDTRKTILKELKKQHKEEELPLLLAFFQDLVKVQLAAEKTLTRPVSGLTEQDIQSRLDEGTPLVGLRELALDWTAVSAAFSSVLPVFSAYSGLFGETRASLDNAGADPQLLRSAVAAWYSGKPLPPDFLPDLGDSLRATIIQSALLPFLSAWAEALKSSVKQDYWRREYCPICGGRPDLAYLEKEVGGRMLLCSRCDFDWAFPRLECPFCRNKDQKKLSFYSDEGGRYRLHVCDNCRGYMKIIDTRQAGPEVLLPLERLYTLDLDVQARELGYSNSGSSPAQT